MNEKPTGYQACQEMVDAILEEIRAVKQQQRRRGSDASFSKQVRDLAQSCAQLQAEIRKTAADADRAVQKLPTDRRVELMLRMLRDLSPEHRSAVRVYLEELGVSLQ